MGINNTSEAFEALQRLRYEKKFVEENLYPGAPTQEIRLRCETSVNRFLDGVMTLLRQGTKKEALFACTKTLLDSFDDEDTEEREKVGDYIGETMRIIGLEDWTDFV